MVIVVEVVGYPVVEVIIAIETTTSIKNIITTEIVVVVKINSPNTQTIGNTSSTITTNWS